MSPAITASRALDLARQQRKRHGRSAALQHRAILEAGRVLMAEMRAFGKHYPRRFDEALSGMGSEAKKRRAA